MSLKHLMAGLMLCLTSHALLAAPEPADSVSTCLEEVVVKVFPKKVKLKSDGFEIKISSTYLANAGTALDVLGKMPFVSKTGQELEVLGRGVPLVYINGRQVRDRSELDQLASSDIKSVDVVTSPGARYDSSVNAVIRITTVAPVGEGSPSTTGLQSDINTMSIFLNRLISTSVKGALTFSVC